jgi:hypothetical protein
MFKIGDNVICSDNNGVESSLTIGQKYVVLSVYEDIDAILVNSKTESYYYSSHFKLNVKKERKEKIKKIMFKPGDKVI